MNSAYSGLSEKKQVSIVEHIDPQELCAKKKREKFKRQDTPLHPHSIRFQNCLLIELTWQIQVQYLFFV